MTGSFAFPQGGLALLNRDLKKLGQSVGLDQDPRDPELLRAALPPETKGLEGRTGPSREAPLPAAAAAVCPPTRQHSSFLPSDPRVHRG